MKEMIDDEKHVVRSVRRETESEREQKLKPFKCDNDAIKTFVNVLQSCVACA